MLISEGIELTRGTKRIIQESIDTVGDQHKDDRLRLCEVFCKIVEDRYAGGAMSYQLKRMGNSYPFTLLSKNNWTLQDALDNHLVVYLDEDWFFSDEIVELDNQYYKVTTPKDSSLSSGYIPVCQDMESNIQEKIEWLKPLIMNNSDGTPTHMLDIEIINLTVSQAKTMGLNVAKKPSVKIPLNTTGPILEAIDKFLYDKSGQYII